MTNDASLSASARRLTAQEKTKFLSEVTAGIGTREAFRRAGVTAGSSTLAVSKATAKAILAADPDLNDDYELARGRDLDKVESRAFTIALESDDKTAVPIIKFLLERAHPAYAANQKVELSGPNGQPVQLEGRPTRLADIAAVLQRTGALGTDGGGASRLALPAPPDALAEPPDG